MPSHWVHTAIPFGLNKTWAISCIKDRIVSQICRCHFSEALAIRGMIEIGNCLLLRYKHLTAS